jgi:hypothetical protein
MRPRRAVQHQAAARRSVSRFVLPSSQAFDASYANLADIHGRWRTRCRISSSRTSGV